LRRFWVSLAKLYLVLSAERLSRTAGRITSKGICVTRTGLRWTDEDVGCQSQGD
jgi:hypothetical protein